MALHLVGMSEGVPGDLAPDAHVIEFGLRPAQRGLDVSEALAVSKLCERQAEELIQAREGNHLVVSVVPLHAFLKLVGCNKVHQLPKDASSHIHQPSASAGMRKCDHSEENISNRKISFWKKNSYFSIC